MQANLHGSSPGVIVGGQDDPDGIAVNGSNIYWTDGSGTIWKAGLDGSDVTPLPVPADDDQDAGGIAVHSSNIYWTNDNDNPGSVWEADLDGTGAQVVDGGQDDPWGVAVGPQ